MTELPNPEIRWQREQAPGQDPRRAVESRLGAIDEPLRLLGGGLANTNVRVGDNRVLRIYHRDPAMVAKERLLLQHPWQSFRVPTVLDAGSDFLLLEYVPHDPLTAKDGTVVGAALAEIHRRRRFATAGLLDSDLRIAEPFDDFSGALRAHLESLQDEANEPRWRRLLRDLVAWLRPLHGRTREHADTAVLLHGDFKLSNLHRCAGNVPLVLDWEFAFAGPPLMDIGQLLRWGVPADFRDSVLRSYRGSGGVLDDEGLAWAPIFDLVGLGDLLARSRTGSERGSDLEARIRAIIDTGPP